MISLMSNMLVELKRAKFEHLSGGTFIQAYLALSKVDESFEIPLAKHGKYNLLLNTCTPDRHFKNNSTDRLV